MTEHCEDCAYWIHFDGDTGECHCKAPLPTLHAPTVQAPHKVARWPLTQKHEICGEFKERPHLGKLGEQIRRKTGG